VWRGHRRAERGRITIVRWSFKSERPIRKSGVVMVPFIVGVAAVVLCVVLTIWSARAVLVAVVALLHRSARIDSDAGPAIQPETGL